MSFIKLFLEDGGNTSKPPCFVGELYDFWKIHMQMYLEAQEDEIWSVVKDKPFIPTSIISGVGQPKKKSYWTNDDHKKVLYDKKSKNIIAFALGMDEFFRV